MFMKEPKVNIIEEFEWKDLHQKVGKIVHVPPTESDIAEGYRHTQVWFVDSEMNVFILEEYLDE